MVEVVERRQLVQEQMRIDLQRMMGYDQALLMD